LEVLEDKTQIWRSFWDGLEYKRTYDGTTYTSWVFSSWKKTTNETDLNTKLNLSGGTMTGILNVPTPSLPS
jgi:hypothetical protein